MISKNIFDMTHPELIGYCGELESENSELVKDAKRARAEARTARKFLEAHRLQSEALQEARNGLEFYKRELGVNGEHPRKGYMMDGVADFELHTDGMYYGGKTARAAIAKIDELLKTEKE